MEYMEFQRFTSEMLSVSSRIDTLATECKDAPDEVKVAYGVVRAQLIVKLKDAVEAFKVKVDALVASKST